MSTGTGDIFSNLREFSRYLSASVQLGGPERVPYHQTIQANMVEVTLSNTASPEGWPRIVFLGVALRVFAKEGGVLEGRHLSPEAVKSWVRRDPETGPGRRLVKPPNPDLARGFIAGPQLFPDLTDDERSHGEALFPGQSLIYEVRAETELLPHLEFRVEWNLSRRHLTHFEAILDLTPSS
jgi:hypothetical protein